VLAGRKGDASQVEELTLVARTVMIATGQTTWEQGFVFLTQTHERMRAAAARAGVAVSGRPVTHFIETDDMGFRFEAMLPVERAPSDMAQIAPFRMGATPAGKALRFVYVGPYEDIDGAYEGVSAYLDAKGLTVRDQFLEEYANDAKDAGDPGFEINIYVFPR
jgi:effector-binding domain-containing protein